MLAIIGGRRTGKTTRLIEMSSATGYPIMTATRHMADSIELQALKMNKEIPKVITPFEYKNARNWNDSVLVDEAGMLIERITGSKVVAASIDGEVVIAGQASSIDLSKLGIWEAFKLWRSERKRARSGGDGM
jgi:hypothetical protein